MTGSDTVTGAVIRAARDARHSFRSFWTQLSMKSSREANDGGSPGSIPTSSRSRDSCWLFHCCQWGAPKLMTAQMAATPNATHRDQPFHPTVITG
jgi:hypothetical protein